MKDDFKTFKALAEKLGVTPKYISDARKKDDSPKGRNLKEWQEYIATNKALGGRGSNQQGKKRITVAGKDYTAADIVKLKSRLLDEQGKGEELKNRLKTLEIEQKEQGLVPKAEAQEAITKVLLPLRRSLDAMPRTIAHRANPQDPILAEKIIRDHLDYIFRTVVEEGD